MQPRIVTDNLALEGGSPEIDVTPPPYNPFDEREVNAAVEVVRSGVLSKFLGAWHPDFFGGPKVQQFERDAADFFGVKHVVTVNSWTSGLVAAVGAIGVEPGDEVIVPPWTMCASATAILHWNAIPVFADIDPRTFNLDPSSIERNVSARTRAIMAVDIFGQSADMDAILSIARRHGLKVISDTAQSPGARYGGRYAGTLADIGGFSLNYHKHFHTGEGGILVTDDSRLAARLQLLRNHAEAVVGPKGETDLVNMVGHNFRLGEIEAAIGIEQLRKLPGLVGARQRLAARLASGLSGLRGLELPFVSPKSTHVYYIFPMVVDTRALGITRARLLEALRAEGVPALTAGYQNVHLLPMYQRRIAFGRNGFPWTSEFCTRPVSYDKGICPVAERLHDSDFIGFAICAHDFTEEYMDSVSRAFRKVWRALDRGFR